MISFKDPFRGVRGVLELSIFRGGRLVEIWKDENTIMDASRTAAALALSGAGAGKVISKIGFGTDGTGSGETDRTGLANAYTKALGAFTYPVSGQMQANWTLAESEANGMSIMEFGLICADGTLFSRKVRSGAITKESDIALAGAWTIIF